MICLETDFLIDILRKNKKAIQKLEELENKEEKLAITPITATELYRGTQNKKEEEKITELLINLKLLNYDLMASKKAGKQIQKLENKGKPIGDLDTITAAINQRHGNNTIVTKNQKHYEKIKNIKTIQW